MKPETLYDVVIIGGGVSGTALLYTLAKYTSLSRIALIEKYPEVGTVNSHAINNSQTLHLGDIETNYPIEKAREVKPAALMVERYTSSLPSATQELIIKKVQKMLLGVGEQEVLLLKDRFPALKEIFPGLSLLDAAGIAEVEPAVMRGRRPEEPVAAFLTEGYAVNFQNLAGSFVMEAEKQIHKAVHVFLGKEVLALTKEEETYHVETSNGIAFSRVVVVDADAYSLGFAKSLGYGKHLSLIPVAGTFFFTRAVLRGKVYTVQAPRMPFASIHGDPDLTNPAVTRFGPTARFYPVLEARKINTVFSFFKISGLHRIATWVSFLVILLDPLRFKYLIMNFFYDLPFIGRQLYVREVQKIVPEIQAHELRRAWKYGGMRLQRVDTKTREMLLGEGKIVGDNIIFNMTPSPGASVCLYNAMRDAEQIEKFLGENLFDKKRMQKDLYTDSEVPHEDVSLKDSYAS